MFKKTILSLLVIGSSLTAEVNLNDQNTVDQLGIAGLKENIVNISKQSLGEWYLYNAQKSIYNKVVNDEFEYDDAWNNALKLALQKIEENQKYIGDNGILRLGATIGKYDFKTQAFPVNAMTKGSYVTFEGSGKMVNRSKYHGLHLSFNNVDVNKNVIPMEKKKAKAFVSKRKNRYGEVNRNITAVYYYTIEKINTPVEDDIQNCSKGNQCYDVSGVKVIGKIKKVEFLDTDTSVLFSYDYK